MQEGACRILRSKASRKFPSRMLHSPGPLPEALVEAARERAPQHL